jgi:hypothetical protein
VLPGLRLVVGRLTATPTATATAKRPINADHGEFIRFIEMHGTGAAPIDGAFASAEDDGYVTVDLRFRVRTTAPLRRRPAAHHAEPGEAA